ncbi:MAG TPA: hypothetical protein VKQ05_01830 [Gemmatimonadales bacterium]|nr:hypothetical protein [Gemmatimonadales bacterium]
MGKSTKRRTKKTPERSDLAAFAHQKKRALKRQIELERDIVRLSRQLDGAHQKSFRELEILAREIDLWIQRQERRSEQSQAVNE